MKKSLEITARSALALAALAFLATLVFPMMMNIINIGNISGAALCVWVLCVSVKPIHARINGFCKKRSFTRFLFRAVNVCFAAFAIYGALVTGAMVFAAAQAPGENATAVVLGAQVKPWGPSVMLRGRINAAENYLNENPNAKAVLSGGKGSDEATSEARCIYDTMGEDGIDQSRLYLEDKSTNTTENLKFSSAVIEENGLNGDIAIATDGFHQLRARIIAKQLGLKGNVGAVNSDTQFVYLPTYAVREWFALPYQLLFR